MYKSFEIKNYKCFEHLKLDNLARVNLIAGKNNVGKTALLEALFVHCGRSNPGLLLTLMGLRGWGSFRVNISEGMMPWLKPFFRDFDSSLQIELQSQETSGPGRKVWLKFGPEPDESMVGARVTKSVFEGNKDVPASTHVPLVIEQRYQDGDSEGRHWLLRVEDGFVVKPYPDQSPFTGVFDTGRAGTSSKMLSERFAKLQRENQEDMLIRNLNIIEPRLTRLSVIQVAESPVLYGDIGLTEKLALSDMGAGIAHLASSFLAMANAEGGLVMLDEIENGLHYTIHEKMWKAIAQAARQFNVQVFATTHSYECIAAASEAFKESKGDEFAFYRLVEIDGKIENTRYSTETFADAINTGWEVR